jgi:hypothetical protein
LLGQRTKFQISHRSYLPRECPRRRPDPSALIGGKSEIAVDE